MEEIYFAKYGGQQGMNFAEILTIFSVSIGVVLFLLFCAIIFTAFEE